MWQGRVEQGNRRAKIDRELAIDVAKLLLRGLDADLIGMLHPRIIHEDRQPPECLNRRGNERLDLIRIAEISHDGDASGAELLFGDVETPRIPRADGDVRSPLQEFVRERESDARTSPGKEDALPLPVEGVVRSIRTGLGSCLL
jgi:hypothetical protein